jgi:hypothetical protein
MIVLDGESREQFAIERSALSSPHSGTGLGWARSKSPKPAFCIYNEC